VHAYIPSKSQRSTQHKKWKAQVVRCDAEYCQIHIDLSKGSDWIKIFSKSGRDSTQDRAKIHG